MDSSASDRHFRSASASRRWLGIGLGASATARCGDRTQRKPREDQLKMIIIAARRGDQDLRVRHEVLCRARSPRPGDAGRRGSRVRASGPRRISKERAELIDRQVTDQIWGSSHGVEPRRHGGGQIAPSWQRAARRSPASSIGGSPRRTPTRCAQVRGRSARESSAGARRRPRSVTEGAEGCGRDQVARRRGDAGGAGETRRARREKAKELPKEKTPALMRRPEKILRTKMTTPPAQAGGDSAEAGERGEGRLGAGATPGRCSYHAKRCRSRAGARGSHRLAQGDPGGNAGWDLSNAATRFGEARRLRKALPARATIVAGVRDLRLRKKRLGDSHGGERVRGRARRAGRAARTVVSATSSP